MLLRPLDIEFAKIPVTAYGSQGTPYVRWIRSGMPKLGKYNAILDAVFFLYESRDDAERGVQSGGTGFLVAIPSRRWPTSFNHIHGISNWHVAVAGVRAPPTPCIRVNVHGNKPEVFEFDTSEWIFAPGGPDVAISPPLRLTATHKAVYLDVKSFLLTAEDEKKDELGPAEDVFMVGRFVDYDGAEENAPALRFGHISIMDAKVHQPTGYIGRSIVVDMHSRSGFSGSPVFAYRTLGSHFIEDAPPNAVLRPGGHYLKLLGIHWGQFPESWELKSKPKSNVKPHSSLITDGAYVEGLSGMTCVVPAAQILNLLNSPELVAMRERNELERVAITGDYSAAPKAESALPVAARESPASAESAAPLATGDNPTHREDFMRLVDAAARKPAQED